MKVVDIWGNKKDIKDFKICKTTEYLQTKRKEIQKTIDDLYKEVRPDRRIRLHSSKVSNITAKDIALITEVPGDTDGDV